MQSKNNVNLKNLLIIISITFLIFARYNGNYHTDYKYIWLFLDGGLVNDIYENNSILLNSSIIFHLFDFFNLNLDNDIYGFIIHLIISIFAFIYLFKIVKKIIPNISNTEILFILFCLSSLDNLFLNTVKSGWIVLHTSVPSHFGLCFFFYYFWNVINKNKYATSILTVIFMLISPRSAWFPALCAFCYFCYPKFKIKNIIYFLPSILLILFYLYFFYTFESFETKKLLYERALYKEHEEIAFHMQNKYFIILTSISFLIFFYFLKLLNNDFKYFFKIILICSTSIFIFGYIYGKYGQFIYPDPKIISISPVRAFYVYQLFFIIAYFALLNHKSKDSLTRYSFYLLPFLFCLGNKGKILALAIIIGLLVYRLNVVKKTLKLIKFDKSYFFILFIFLISINSAKNRFHNVDFYTFDRISHWSTQMGNKNNEFKDFFLNLRSCNDFLIFDNLRDIPAGNNATRANFFANKSKYFSDTNVNVAFNKKLYNEHYKRQSIIYKIKNNKFENLQKLKNENFLYVANKDELFNDELLSVSKDFGNLIFFYNDKELNKLKKNCNILFK